MCKLVDPRGVHARSSIMMCKLVDP